MTDSRTFSKSLPHTPSSDLRSSSSGRERERGETQEKANENCLDLGGWEKKNTCGYNWRILFRVGQVLRLMERMKEKVYKDM